MHPGSPVNCLSSCTLSNATTINHHDVPISPTDSILHRDMDDMNDRNDMNERHGSPNLSLLQVIDAVLDLVRDNNEIDFSNDMQQQQQQQQG